MFFPSLLYVLTSRLNNYILLFYCMECFQFIQSRAPVESTNQSCSSDYRAYEYTQKSERPFFKIASCMHVYII